MPVKFQFMNQRLQTWILCHQTYNSVYKCEETVFAREGLSTQQHAVLMAIKYIKGPVTISELAHWLERNQNGISALVYRMEKDGLILRTRDLPDRRSVRLVMSEKGKNILEQSTISGWNLVQEILSGLSNEELITLNGMLERMREKAFGYLNPDKSIEEIKTDEARNMTSFMKRMSKYTSGTAPAAGHHPQDTQEPPDDNNCKPARRR